MKQQRIGFPERIVIKCDPATFAALGIFAFFALVGILFCLSPIIH